MHEEQQDARTLRPQRKRWQRPEIHNYGQVEYMVKQDTMGMYREMFLGMKSRHPE